MDDDAADQADRSLRRRRFRRWAALAADGRGHLRILLVKLFFQRWLRHAAHVNCSGRSFSSSNSQRMRSPRRCRAMLPIAPRKAARRQAVQCESLDIVGCGSSPGRQAPHETVCVPPRSKATATCDEWRTLACFGAPIQRSAHCVECVQLRDISSDCGELRREHTRRARPMTCCMMCRRGLS